MATSLRVKAASIHLLASAAMAAIVGAMILGVWFPGDYLQIAHGWQLLVIILGVDCVCGPLLTGILFNPRKSRRELTLDMSLVVLIQVAALAYGVHAAWQARPVVTAFEGDRFRVITAAEIDPERLVDAPSDLRVLPFNGPRVIGVRIPRPTDPDYGKTVDLALAGLDVSFRPGFWHAYKPDVALRASRPVSALKARYPDQSDLIDRTVAKSGVAADALNYVPAQNRRNDDWVALIDRTDGRIVGFVPVDGF
jgi:hypothetical protein